MKKTYFYIGLVLTLVSSTLQAQEKRIERANKIFKDYAFIDAQKAYLKVVEKGYTSQDLYEKLGDSYYFNADLASASKWYGRLYDEYLKNMKSEYLFRYSHALKNIGQYKQADKIMEAYDVVSGNKNIRAELFKKERNYLELIEMQSGRFEILNEESINTKGSDFGPSFYKNESIFFASDRSNARLRNIHEWTKAPFLNLFVAERTSRQNSSLHNAIQTKGKVNTRYHESSTVFTPDGNTMYFTRNNYTKNKRESNTEGTTLLKLYKAEKKDGKWSNIVELPFNGKEYSVAHPALSPDGKRLYFASDMPGTKGLSDIFYVTIDGEDKYGKPVNLGTEINTEGRETFPFISKNGYLFFASDGHIGLGGLDVFVAEKSKGDFEVPFNLGAPLNSPDDDFSFIIDDFSKTGYFTSNRPGGLGNDDIYSFKQIEDLTTSCNQYLSGLVTDAKTRSLLPNAKITLLTDDLNVVTSTIADAYANYSLPIECDKKYVIRAEKGNYEPTEVDFTSSGVFEYKHNQPLQLRKGLPPIKKELKANIGDDLAKILQLNPIYFDFDKDFIRPDAEIELQKIIVVMKEYPNMKIDVRSHTDSRAPFDYNVGLSTRRNKNTIKYIVKKGSISSNRLTGRGYGEIELTNKCADGVNCSEEEHQLNRRSEFIILKQ